jgi:PAS domain S-box-containing protein
MKATQMGERDVRIGRRFALASAAVAIVLGILGLAGQAFHLPVLASIRAGYHPIALSVAVALALLALLLVVAVSGSMGRRARLIAAAVAGLALLHGLLEVVGFVVGADLSGEDALTRYLAKAWSLSLTPMSPAAGALVLVVGASVLALLLSTTAARASVRERLREAAGTLGAIAAGGSLVFVLGYLYGAPLLYGGGVIPIAAAASLGFLVLGLGLAAAAGADGWPLRVFVGPSVRAQLLRAFVPLTVLAVLFSSLLRERVPAVAHLNRALESSLLATAFALLAGVVGYQLAAVLGGAIERAQRAQQESEARLHLAQEAAKAGTWEWDLGTNDNTWSEELWKLYGLAPHSVVPSYQAWLAVVHPDDRARAEQSIQEAARQGSELDLEWRVRDPDGSERWLLSRGQPIREASGERVVRYLGIVLDITERKRVEAERARLLDEIEEQRVLLNTIVENTEAHLVYLDRDFNFIWVNPAYARACRRSPEEFVGHNHFEFYPHAENEAIFRRVRDTGIPFQARERPFDFPDIPERGTTYWDWTLTPIKDESGAVAALVFSLADVTEKVQARQRIEEAERQRAQLAETMSAEIDHRMKNNLALIAALLQMQLSSAAAGASTADLLHQAIARIHALAVVHGQLYEARSTHVEMVGMLRRVGEAALHALASADVDLSVSGTAVSVPSKEGSTLAVLANELITNAVKYGGPDRDGARRVRIGVSRQDGEVRITVWNSGNPIPDDFDPAARSGLGLQLAREAVVGQWQGEFSLHPADGGTVAEIMVRADALAAGEPQPESTPSPGAGA